MYSAVLIFTFLLYFTNGEKITNAHEKSAINNISEVLITLLNVENNGRINELRDKLANISTYVLDNDKINKLLVNATKETNLNETNFYKALNDDDHFRFVTKDEPKNLYLKLKEKLNRDDIKNILTKNGIMNDHLKSGRKRMGNDYFGEEDNDMLDEVLDKMIAETPNDNHTFSSSIKDGMYWDPQNELEDLRDYHKHDGRRLYKGERTTVRYYPFMVSIHVMGRFWCGGSIYWHDLVLTSASCLQLLHNNRFFRENPKVLQVRIGSNHSRIGGEVLDALEVYFNPGYNPRTLRNNIAIIRLRRHLYFNYHRIPKVITISHTDTPMPSTAEVLLLGWGVTKSSQKMLYEPIYLQRKFLPVYPNKFCKEVYGDKFITTTMFCAGTLTTGEGACDHDAGGPAVLAGKLFGIISFGPTVCGYPNAPTVFTLVGAFADWIETINETMPDYYRGAKKTTTTTQSSLLDMLQGWPNNFLYKKQKKQLSPIQVSSSVEVTVGTKTT